MVHMYKNQSSVNIISMLSLNHKNLKVWNTSIVLVKEIYVLTNRFPACEKFGLTSQLRRASVSVASNISEGASRKSKKERTRFFEISRSSLVEIDTQIEIAITLGYIKENEIDKLHKLANKTFAMLSAMI